jgi:signal transduction histidine kinase
LSVAARSSIIMLKRRAIPVKLATAVGIPVLASVIFAILAVSTLQRVRIGGGQYNEIAEANDLVADILPPPAYIVESMLLVELLIDAPDAAYAGQLRSRLDTLQQQFETSQARWREDLNASEGQEQGELRTLVTDDAAEDARKFFATVQNELYPAMDRALASGNRDEVNQITATELLPLYNAHRISIDQAVVIASARRLALEEGAEQSARNSFVILGLTLAGLMLAAITLATVVARAIVRPIFELSSAANDVAGALTEADLDAETPELEPLELDSSPELNVAADSFNTMIATTLDLVDRQARMRRNLSEIFQNLGRRNHGLLNRSLQVITQLERDETDPETLEQLFRLDHLATRLRRNAENLLILAGSQSARSVERQSAMADIVRSALSEIEEYTRVDRPELEAVAVKAGAVTDTTHLIAELLENATSFSPPGGKVRVHGAFVEDGYVVTIVDEGLGMRADVLADANQRIEKLARLDLTPTRTLGLYVVGRLADRHGIRVRLLEGSLRGTVAKVTIPTRLLADPIAAEPTPNKGEAARQAPALAAKTAVADRDTDERATTSEAEEPVKRPEAEERTQPAGERAERGTDRAAERPSKSDRKSKPAPTAAPVVKAPTSSNSLRPAGEERNGMRRRVRGAQMPETHLEGLGDGGGAEQRPVTAEQVERDRNSLSSFQTAVQKGERDGRAAKEEEK